MKQKWLLTGAALMFAAALEAANIEAADADISSTTLSEVAGVTFYKVEFTSGDHAYSYSINAETGEVLEASYRDNIPCTLRCFHSKLKNFLIHPQLCPDPV